MAEMAGRLAGKVRVITGTGGSLGRATAGGSDRRDGSRHDVTGIDLVVDGGMKAW